MHGWAGRLVFAILLVLSPAGESLAAPMDPAAFAAEIRRLSELISAAPPESVSRIAVPPVWAVASRGQTFEVPAVWLQRALRSAATDPAGWSAQRTGILEQLASMEREAAALMTARSFVDRAAARTTLQSVLSAPEFRRIAADSVFAQLRALVARWFDRLWRRLGGDRLDLRNAARAAAWLISAAALLVLLLWVRRSLRPSTASPSATGDMTTPRSTPTSEWARLALAASSPRESARCAYRAAVSRLQDQGLWRMDDARTPREYLGLLPVEDARNPAVTDVLRRFEEVWFAGRQATEDDRRQLVGRLRELGCLPSS